MAVLSTDGYTQGWLDYEKLLGQRPILSGSAEAIIEASNTLNATLAAQSPPPDNLVQTREDSADGVPIRIYTPTAALSENKLPIGVYYHGGGYLVGNLDSEDLWCRFIAKATPCIVVSVDYRLSTVAKLPAQLEDSVIAYKWVCTSFVFLSNLRNALNNTNRCGPMLRNWAEIRLMSSLSEHQQAAASR
jgi:versiconal hemiacetal acetate esterase